MWGTARAAGTRRTAGRRVLPSPWTSPRRTSSSSWSCSSSSWSGCVSAWSTISSGNDTHQKSDDNHWWCSLSGSCLRTRRTSWAPGTSRWRAWPAWRACQECPVWCPAPPSPGPRATQTPTATGATCLLLPAEGSPLGRDFRLRSFYQLTDDSWHLTRFLWSANYPVILSRSGQMIKWYLSSAGGLSDCTQSEGPQWTVQLNPFLSSCRANF